MSILMKLKREELEEIGFYLKPYIQHPEVQRMKNYIAHGNITVLQHAVKVALIAYQLNKKYKLNADLKTLLAGALLHDFYGYDWHEKKLNFNVFQMHGFTHPTAAKDNAVKTFNISEEIQKVIVCHMWPLTLRSYPSSKEAKIVCIADKICATKETLHI